MITYRDCSRRIAARDQLERLERLATTGDAGALLAEAGEAEQAALDALHPDRDAWDEPARCFGELLLGAAGRYLNRPGSDVAGALGRLRALDWPDAWDVRAPEGFLQYALDPMAYVRAARKYAGDAGEERARRAAVVGVRSIGTTLSAVVAAALGSERRVTLRPRGASGERRLDLDATLRRRLDRWTPDGADWLIVDEGPGATGETFEAVAAGLHAIGVPQHRIVLFPAHDGGMGLAPPERRAWYGQTRKYPAAWEDRLSAAADALGLSGLEDLSYGRWRDALGLQAAPSAAHHERQKARARAADGQLALLRYAGLGRWGEEARRRAERLAALGIGPQVLGFHDGYLALEWVDGAALGTGERTLPDVRRGVARYLSARHECFPAGVPVDRSLLLAALLENAREALGGDPPGLNSAAARLERLPEREAFVADGRLAPWEWVRTAGGLVKVDALDHGDGTRLPGPTDALWDVAAAAVEFDLPPSEIRELLDRLEPRTTARRELDEVLRAYRPVYAAACLGENTLSSWECGDEADRALFRQEAERYRYALAAELHSATMP